MSDRWFQTYTGKRFVFDDLSTDDVCIEDIAHHLAFMCRYNGAVRYFYSVAEHSVHVSRYCPEEHALWGLMHDAAEAYVGDLPSPVKQYLLGRNDNGFKHLEFSIMFRIASRFGMKWPCPSEVKEVDLRILNDERDQLMEEPPLRWACQEYPPLVVWLKCWAPGVAEGMFIERFRELTDA